MTNDYLTGWPTVAAALGMLFVAFLIVRIAKRNAKEDAANEERPRRAWYQLGCKECREPTPHGAIVDGLCPECGDVADKTAEISIRTTPDMLNAGVQAMKASADPDTVFRAMLKAMPLEQKRVMLRNPIFTVPKPELIDPA